MGFAKQLQDFLKSNSHFNIVYSSASLAGPATSRILVLDSSFNPPHLAHWALAEEALKFQFDNNGDTASRSLLLLLSVKNADKVQPLPALFEHRLEMMYLMAKRWERAYQVPVSIGLTDHAKFVDKALAIRQYLKQEGEDPPVLTFLVGFDTLERILDPKYYLPDKLLDSLDEFMKTTDLFCLTRLANVEAYKTQVEYIQKLHHGGLAHIPLAWANRVHLASVDKERDTVGQISSTAVRNAFAAGLSVGGVAVDPEIKAYIEENDLYKQ